MSPLAEDVAFLRRIPEILRERENEPIYAGELAAALGHAEHLAQSAPGDPELTEVIQDLRRQAIKAQDP
jgi:hypothetical protein